MVHRRTSADFHPTSNESLAGLPRHDNESELRHRKTNFSVNLDRYPMLQVESAQIVGGVGNQHAEVLGPTGACADGSAGPPVKIWVKFKKCAPTLRMRRMVVRETSLPSSSEESSLLTGMLAVRVVKCGSLVKASRTLSITSGVRTDLRI